MGEDIYMDARREIDTFKAWLIERETAPSTIESYTYTLKEFFGMYSEFRKETVLNYKQWLLDVGKKPTTVNLRLCAIMAYSKMKGVNLTVKKVKYQKQTSVENVITEEEYQRLLDGLSADGNWQWYWNVRLLAATGCRVSEVIRLTKADYDNGEAEMWTKGKVRRILIPEMFRVESAEHYAQLADGELLVAGRYGTMTTRGIAAGLRKLAERYNIPKKHMHPHAFRHRFAINFLKRNPNLSLLADIMGHSAVSTTAIYTRLTRAEQMKQANETINW